MCEIQYRDCPVLGLALSPVVQGNSTLGTQSKWLVYFVEGRGGGEGGKNSQMLRRVPNYKGYWNLILETVTSAPNPQAHDHDHPEPVPPTILQAQ